VVAEVRDVCLWRTDCVVAKTTVSHHQLAFGQLRQANDGDLR